MAVNGGTKPKRLRDYKIHSERVLMRNKEPGVFERELGPRTSRTS